MKIVKNLIVVIVLSLSCSFFPSNNNVVEGVEDPLAGVFTTSPVEVLKETMLTPTFGQVPNWISGDYIKQSVSKFEENTRHLTHTFDGYGKILRYRFQNGNASLRAIFLKSNFYNVSTKTGDVCPSRLLGTTQPYEKNTAATTNNCTDNYNVNVFNIACDNIVLLSDFTGGYILNPNDLTTKIHKWNDTWTKYFDKITAAHPARTKNGNTINFVMRINPMAIVGIGKHSIIVYRVDQKNNSRSIIATIKIKKLSYIHSFTVTENYVILAAAPFTWELGNIMIAKPVLNSLKWSPSDGTEFYVVGLNDNKVTQYSGTAFFSFHHINGYEKDNIIYMDLLANNMTSGKVPVAGLTIHNMLNMSIRDELIVTSECRRYEIPIPSSSANSNSSIANVNYTVVPLVDDAGKRYDFVELPRMNNMRHAETYCYWYGWAPHAAESKKFADTAIIKVDLCKGNNAKSNVKTWFVKKHFPSEPVFVKKPSGGGGGESMIEDDGVLLTAVYDGNGNANYLAIINATSMTTVATLYCQDDWKHLMAFGIHGDFFDSSKSQQSCDM